MGLHDGGQSRHLEGNGESGTVMLGITALAQTAFADLSATFPVFVPSPPIVPVVVPAMRGITRAGDVSGDTVLYIGGVLDTPYRNPRR